MHSDCGQEYLARGAQQQAAQREERQGEEAAKKQGLLHGGDYSPKNRTKATFPAAVGLSAKPAIFPENGLVSKNGCGNAARATAEEEIAWKTCFT